MSTADSTDLTSFANRVARWLLVLWTFGIWVSRIRNIAVDEDLTGSERALSLTVAVVLVILAVVAGLSMWLNWSTHALALGTLVAVGVARWTIRAPIILASNEWSNGFKVVHTVLWVVTVVLSVLAWREFRRPRVIEPG